VTDYRILVKVEFTMDIGLSNNLKIFEAQDTAELITREVFDKSFSRAHLLKIEVEELLQFERK
jgi:hypothetical protein